MKTVSSPVALAISVVTLLGAGVDRASGSPGIVVTAETATSMTMRFTRAAGEQSTVQFSRPNLTGYWRASAQPEGVIPGITFGNANPRYGRSSRLREFGISPEQALRTMSSGIASRPHDDLTIFQLFEQGEIAVCLWTEGTITEIWYAGEFVNEVLAGFPSQDPEFHSVCGRLKRLCCRKRELAPTDPPTPCPQEIPNPRISSCVAAATHCRGLVGSAVCDCLFDACRFCGQAEECCAVVPGLEDLSAEACEAWIANRTCNLPEPPASTDPNPGVEQATALLGEVVDRMQSIIDSRPAE